MHAVNGPAFPIPLLLLVVVGAPIAGQTPAAARIVLSEFVYDSAPFPSAHASTIVETRDGVAAAWFGGSRESAPDVGIWFARKTGTRWTPPIEVATGIQAGGLRYPCWNPVLFEPRDGPLMLFYKVGPNPREWWGMLRTSKDGGRTWSEAKRLPDGIIGPSKNKPLQLADGAIVSPSSTESSDSGNAWRVHFELSHDLGATWSRSADVGQDAIQPTILALADGPLEALARTRTGFVAQSMSTDGGTTWSPLVNTTVPNPNAGIDAITLRDGRHLLVYNQSPRVRSPLNVAISVDGTHWKPLLVLETELDEFSYPAVIQTADGLVHVTYTWKRRRIRHVVIDPGRP